MDILPKSSKAFSAKEYWNEFFAKRGSKAFEWYGEYVELCGHLQKYMKSADNILIAGCGNSEISGDLYKVGFSQITNVDISEIVIRQMTEKYGKTCPNMKWVAADLFKLPFEDGAFSCVLDKGTLDALMSDDVSKVGEKAERYFKELGRVLRVGGRYICISLLQEHILSSLISHFPKEGWMLRFSRSEEAESSQLKDGNFSFPVFVIICTKFKPMPNMDPVIEINMQEGQFQRVDISKVKSSVEAVQQFSLVKHNLRNKLNINEEVSLELYDSKSGTKRFDLFVLDAPKKTNSLPFAVFIVPQGRETEWLFGTTKGQTQLADSAGSNRLIVVHLMRNQVFGTMKDVQDELSSKVIELAPPKLPQNYKIPFLSIGGDLGERIEVYRGQSEFSGEFVVEDVKEDSGGYLRRLVFLSNQNLIQSEAQLISGRKKKNNRQNMAVDPSYLACSHHSVMVTSIQMTSLQSSVVLVGLGGGALSNFIHKYFPKVNLTVVDIDPAIVEVAKTWFNFQTDQRLKCQVEDGIEFIQKAASNGTFYDIVMFDIDSKEVSEGLSCPPKQFVEGEFLKQVSKCIKDKGMFVLNLACRDETLRQSIIEVIQNVFGAVASVSIPDEVNVVLFCKKNQDPKWTMNKLEKDVINLSKHLKSVVNKDVFAVKEILDNLKIL